jgi:hypothetical protein
VPRAMNTMLHIKKLLEPSGAPRFRFAAPGVVLLLVASASCVLVAPWAMPASYSWLSNAISESGAQGVYSAWIVRLGFLFFGFSVLWLAAFLRPNWARSTYWMHRVFGMCMIGTAAFSHKPWLTNVPFDPFEDFLHSVTATGMGFAFALGVVGRVLQREESEILKKAWDVVAIIAATALPPLGELWPSIAGLLQRTLFLVAYLWYAHEAVTARSISDNWKNR